MAITSIDIDKQLLHDARELLGASSNREAVQRALEYTVTMQRQQRALDRISSRAFTEEQMNAAKVDYSAS
ncbi:type II toxin-antitoxin system VapB family antitoxin [Herbiconiux sp. VKM Ac-2851]|uniref:type II toxin-antitoxin system VapB family antitoxin n=1 Tax=Herbiconiux sp. VKM Ac-2851 TaxID=2739025 RepID=UPI001563E4CD|nr:type II toxin-antitoxin system VapB family antitoxin [Herbiconiux sp. VKM Ac-2851]NQX34436.1 type II toxin-antitoxin system VapB family antitoxin [Herbiconiux sp. VKM Ac-2851]